MSNQSSDLKLTPTQRDQTFVEIISDSLNEYREAGGNPDQAIIMLLEVCFRIALTASQSKLEAMGRYLGLADSIQTCASFKLLKIDLDWVELVKRRKETKL